MRQNTWYSNIDFTFCYLLFACYQVAHHTASNANFLSILVLFCLVSHFWSALITLRSICKGTATLGLLVTSCSCKDGLFFSPDLEYFVLRYKYKSLDVETSNTSNLYTALSLHINTGQYTQSRQSTDTAEEPLDVENKLCFPYWANFPIDYLGISCQKPSGHMPVCFPLGYHCPHLVPEYAPNPGHKKDPSHYQSSFDSYKLCSPHTSWFYRNMSFSAQFG